MAQISASLTPRETLDKLLRKRKTDLETTVAKHRRLGRSWRWIASEVSRTTGYDISYESLRNWFPEYNKPVHELAEVKG